MTQIPYPNKKLSEEDFELAQNRMLENKQRIIKLCNRLYIAENQKSNTPHANKNKRGIQRSIDRIIKSLTEDFMYGFLPNSNENRNTFWTNLCLDIKNKLELSYAGESKPKDISSIASDIKGYLRENWDELCDLSLKLHK